METVVIQTNHDSAKEKIKLSNKQYSKEVKEYFENLKYRSNLTSREKRRDTLRAKRNLALALEKLSQIDPIPESKRDNTKVMDNNLGMDNMFMSIDCELE